MRTYLINLDRHPERLALILPRLADLDYERIAAVDGTPLSGPMAREHGAPFLAETLTRFERACLESHRVAWTRFLQGGDATCCVLEDDVELSDHFAEFVARPDVNSGDYELIKIERASKDAIVCGPRVAAIGDRELRPLLSSHLGSAGYFINRARAARLLDQTTAPTHPIDWILFHPALNPPNTVLQLLPALCQQRSIAGDKLPHPSFASSIQLKSRKPKKTLATRVQREISGTWQRMSRWAPISRTISLVSSITGDGWRSPVEYR